MGASESRTPTAASAGSAVPDAATSSSGRPRSTGATSGTPARSITCSRRRDAGSIARYESRVAPHSELPTGPVAAPSVVCTNRFRSA